MTLTNVYKLLNKQLAGGILTAKEAALYLDYAIDSINVTLNSNFPTFTEVIDASGTAYDYFPDKYIRMAVIPGAAWNYFTVDEEGSQVAMQTQMTFEQGKFYMLRDYASLIPDQYRLDGTQGCIVGNPDNLTTGDRGIEIDGYDIIF